MMEDENPNGTTPQPDDFANNEIPGPNKKGEGMKIVGFNILGLAVYSLLCLSMSGGGILDALLLLVHVIICIGVAISRRSWFWLLAGLLVLIIGFSTCVTVGLNGL